MKNDILMRVLAVSLGVYSLAGTGFCATWYVNDEDTTLDVYCSAAGNDANDGKSPATPKLSIGTVGTSEEFMPGDTLYIDTGTYNLGSVYEVFSRSGTSDRRISIQGSPKGTRLVRQGNPVVSITGSYLDFCNLRIEGTSAYNGLILSGCAMSTFNDVDVLTTSPRGITFEGASSSNRFIHGVIAGFSQMGVFQFSARATGNEFFSMTLCGQGTGFNLVSESGLARVENSIVKTSASVFSSELPNGEMIGNVLFSASVAPKHGMATIADLEVARSEIWGNAYGEPLFVDGARGDYHLQSPYGYWKTETNANGYVSGGAWVTNAAMGMSPGVDFGYENEWTSYTNEPSPNGGRVNAGAYGGTAEASKSHPDGEKWLYAASFNDGGNLIGSGVFEWRAGGFAAGEKVRLQYTHNGTTWSNIALVVATNETYKWTVPAGAAGAWSMWRVRTTNSTGWIASTNAAAFSVRNSDNPSISCYVNDSSRDGAVYCSAVGSDANTGVDPAHPKATLQAVLDTYQLLPGDVVYVDTGVYEDTDGTNVWTTTLSALDAGSADSPVTIRGAGAGTVFAGTSKSRDVMLVSGDYYDLRDFAVTGGRYGIQLTGSTNHVEGVRATNNVQGVVVSGRSNKLDRILPWKNSQYGVNANGGNGTVLDHSVVWENGTASVIGRADRLAVWNSVLGGSTGYAFAGNDIPAGDYNAINAPGISSTRSDLASLLAVATSNSWRHTVVRDVQFADADDGDFHLKAGSPAIDSGDPAAEWSSEPSPNGGRLNIGLYGNTADATTSATGARIQLLSFVDGGTLDAGTGATIRWNAADLPAGATLTLWLRRGSAGAWEVLATGIDASAGEYLYIKSMTENQSSLEAYLKLTLDSAPETVYSETEKPLIFRDGAFSYYVNDSSTSGDVYCTAPGDPEADGLGRSTPLASVAQVIAKYRCSPGDTIYVDTGVYTNHLDTWVLADNFAGTEEKPIRILGSTNYVAGGTRMGYGRWGVGLGIRINPGAEWVEISDIAFANCSQGAVLVTNASHIVLDGISMLGGGQQSAGFTVKNGAEDITLRHVASRGGVRGLVLEACNNVLVDHSVFANNVLGVSAQANSGATLQNSILYTVNPTQTLYSVQSGAFTADYNSVFAGGDALITSGGIENLRAWQVFSGLDAHSVSGDPLMADPANDDFHLMTERTLGRWLPNGQRTTDGETSPLIGAGKPVDDGTRPNIGLYGDTRWASLPPSGKWIKTLSFNDAGGVGSETVPLRWVASEAASNDNVRVEVSRDGGKTWPVTVAKSVKAGVGEVAWKVGSAADTPAALWRVRATGDASLADANDAFFAIRKQPLKIYVATADTNETVYVSAPGRADNWEATPAAPLNSLQSALDAYDLEGGDTVYLDRGVYVMDAGVTVGRKDSGTVDNPVNFTGVSAKPFNGAMFELSARKQGSVLLNLDWANDVRFSCLSLSNSWTGVYMTNAVRVALDAVRVTHVASNAVTMCGGSSATVFHSVLDDSLVAGAEVRSGASLTVLNSYLPSSVTQPLLLSGGSLCVSNSIMEASGMGRSVFRFANSSSQLASDYNCIHAGNNANVSVDASGLARRYLNEWQAASGNDVHSVGYNPSMVDPENGDYHLHSAAGRYDSSTGGFVTDEETSRLIDLGVPSMDSSEEPLPNGGRVNIGVFGGTAQASKTAVADFIAPLTMSSGGTIRGDVDLYWTYSADYIGNEKVNVLLSTDAGETWTCLASNLYINDGSLHWASTNAPSTAQGVWKVELADNPAVYGQTETLFSIKNDPLTYYVNDSSTNGDVYCSVGGSEKGTGISPDSPIDSLLHLLARYKLEAGDKVYVDTGTYRAAEPVVFSSMFETVEDTWLTIQGSTNYAAGGTVLLNTTNTAVLELRKMASVEFRDLRLRGGSRGVSMTESSSNRFWRVACLDSSLNGFEINYASTSNLFDECAAVNFVSTGLVQTSRIPSQSFIGTNIWNGGIFLTKGMNTNGMPLSTGLVVGVQAGVLRVQNSALALRGNKDVAFVAPSGGIESDHNAFWMPERGALIGRMSVAPVPAFGIQTLAFADLAAWRKASGQDSESFAGNPLWLDEDNLDFHVRSEAGHYNRVKDEWENDNITSPLLGTGAVGEGGVRRNVGWYGASDDPEASRIPSKLSLVLLDYADGGVLTSNATMRWIARGDDLSKSVTARYAGAGGARGDIGTVPAGAGSVEWNISSLAGDALMHWNFGSGTNFDAVWDSPPFVLHTSGISYYVNDESIEGDVYCSVAGSSEYTGLRPDSPLASISDLLDRYHLVPGDKVYWDAGTYDLDSILLIDNQDSGSSDVPVEFVGAPHGKTVVNGLLRVANARGVSLKNIVVNAETRRGNSLAVEYSEDIALDGIDLCRSDWNAMQVGACSNVWASHMVLAHAQTNGLVCEGTHGGHFSFMTIASNAAQQVVVRQNLSRNPGSADRRSSFMTLSNSVVAGAGDRIPLVDVYGTIYSDYNDFFAAGGALVAMTHDSSIPKELRSVNAWFNESGQDSSSLSYDPRFVDGRRGRCDFHLQSLAGHYGSTTGDDADSPLIDAGNPSIPVGDEPEPNGGRVNLGRHGGTDEASKTSGASGLTLIALNDGGRASGNAFPITWLARGDTSNAKLTIRFIDGASTNTLATGVDASSGIWHWDTTRVPQTVQGTLILEADDGSTARNAAFFSVRNPGQTFKFYVNDYTTDGDEYCNVIGDNTKDGLTPDTPVADLNVLLNRYKLESGDTVFIDAGCYTNSSPWRITQDDSAEAEGLAPVVFQGATNRLYNGTVLERKGDLVGIQIDYAIGVSVRNITVSNTSEAAISVNNCVGCDLQWMTVGNAELGIRLNGGNAFSMAHCVLHDLVDGISLGNNTATNNIVYPLVEHCVVWKPAGTAVRVSDKATLRHNVFAPSSGQYVYSLTEKTVLESDYNAFVLEAGARVFCRTHNDMLPTIYDSVGAWVNASGQDAHSYDGEPGFVDADELDFRLKSRVGHCDGTTGTFIPDGETSALVDAGDPAVDLGDEPAPNGGRRNIGLYGGTSSASKSDSDGRFNLLTYNNGGVASGRVPLNWNALGSATGTTVRVEVSLDNGDSWPIWVGEGIDASVGGVLWNSSDHGSSVFAKWRVVDENGGIATAESGEPFVLHNDPIVYYVNDDEVAEGDYCTVPGDDVNDGLSPDTPKRNLADIVATYNLEPGDVVLIDSGIYQVSEPIVIGDLDSGAYGLDASGFVSFIGQTNKNADITLFVTPDSDCDIIRFEDNSGFFLSHMHFVGAHHAVDMRNTYYVEAEWLDMKDGYRGMSMIGSSNIFVRHSLMQGNKESAVYFSGAQNRNAWFDNCVMWSNRYGIHLGQGTVGMSNSVVGVSSDDGFAYYTYSTVPYHNIVADYNDIFVEKGRVAGLNQGSRTSVYARVSTWSADLRQDAHSLVQDPLFVDPDKGDFHLKSAEGHWNAQAGWVMGDGKTSPLIDAGVPSSQAWVNEPDPNGRRLNIGLYGGTGEASRTPAAGWITALSLVDGGTASGLIELRWKAGGAATNDMVTIEFSDDGGITWGRTIVRDWPASIGNYVWDSTDWGATAQGMWRIMSQRDESISDGSLVPFILRNGGSIRYYVNDTSLAGDVYCENIGNDANDGLTPATPKASLQAIIDAYDLSPEDVVYVDAGNYTVGAPAVVIGPGDSGVSNIDLYVTIQGSTNPVARTVFRTPADSPAGINLSYAQKVKLRDLTVQNALVGIQMDWTVDCILENVRLEKNRNVGLSLSHAEGTRVLNSLFWNNMNTMGGVAVAASQSDISISHSVLWGSWSTFSASGASLAIDHSVLDAHGSNGRVYPGTTSFFVTNGVVADYNAYSIRDGALLAEQSYQTGPSDYYGDIQKWIVASGQDRHSLTTDPLFANAEKGDFHLLSSAGRFTTNDWAEAESPDDHWVFDVRDSPLIDAGNPLEPVGDEPVPNGNTVNIGMYGGTGEASHSSEDPWVRALSLNSPAVVSAPVLLHWSYGGLPGDKTVRLEYSVRNWEAGSERVIASDIPVAEREYEWDIVKDVPLALALQWRVVVEENPGVFDASGADVAVKTETYTYYVNDDDTRGDVYCTAPGVDWTGNDEGRSPDKPLKSLPGLFNAYPVGAGDIIKIDTGFYNLGGESVVLGGDEMGTPEMPLTILGSPNGSVFTSSTNAFIFQNTRFMVVSNISVKDALNGFVLQNVSGMEMDNIQSCGNVANGLSVANGTDINIRNALFADNGGYGVYSSGNRTEGRNLCNATVVNNVAGGLYSDRNFGVSNSIFANFTSNDAMLLVLPAQISKVEGDYNLYWSTRESGIWATNAFKKNGYANLRQWQSEEGTDVHSLFMDPRFVDDGSGDYHLQSRQGYWTPNGWQTSPETSWAIDAADPGLLFDDEPLPNGSRRNLGCYGGSTKASKTDASVRELEVLSFRDGGVATVDQMLFWAGRGLDADAAVRLEYSSDNGNSWKLIGTSTVGAGVEGYVWGNMGWTPSPLAQWRVVLMSDPSVVGQTPTNFTYRPSPLVYYVNDHSTDGDVYTTAVGASSNNGYEAGSPLDSIDAVLARYQLTPGDFLLIDSGAYELDAPIVWSMLNAGSSNAPVTIQGSTNPARPSLFAPVEEMSEAAFAFAPTHDVVLSHLTLSNFTSGVTLGQQDINITLRHLDIVGSKKSGISLSQASGTFLDHVLVRESAMSGLEFASSSITVDASVFWNNTSNAITLGVGAGLVMSNSLLHASGFGHYCYSCSTNIERSRFKLDYNNLFITDNAQIASVNGVQYERLPQWTLAQNFDIHSLSADPLFHDPEHGDFHVRSIHGRYELKNGVMVETRDTHEEGVPDVSPMVDAGAPGSSWEKEPSPNGGRREIGIYGDTPEASKSPEDPWLLAVTAMSGGLLNGTFFLSWNYGGELASNAPVRLEYSPYNGQAGSWTFIANANAGAGSYYWVSDARNASGDEKWMTSPEARWRVMLVADTNVLSETTLPFGLRNQPFKYYVNDASTEGDLWCTAPGGHSVTNTGFWPNAPKDSIQGILEDIDVEPTDEIYMDTGHYMMDDTNRPIRWLNSDSGVEGQPVKWIGSTNGVVIDIPNAMVAKYALESSGDYLSIDNIGFSARTRDPQAFSFTGEGLDISNVSISNVALEISSVDSSYSGLAVMGGRVSLSGLGNTVRGLEGRNTGVKLVGTNVSLLNSVVHSTNSVAVEVDASGSVLRNCTVVAPVGTAVLKTGTGTLTLEGNILVAGGGRDAAALEWRKGGLVSDWNAFHVLNPLTWLGINGPNKWEKLAYWQADTGRDANSVSFEPLFVDETSGDYHLQSTAGRWDAAGKRWIPDGADSPLIDLGNPARGTGDEIMPNGYRPNLGAYGGMAQASKSPSNFWVRALSQNDGGVVTGSPVTLRWAANQMPAWNEKTVNLLYSSDGGATWQSIASGILAKTGVYSWNTTGLPDSFNAIWRVEDAEDSSIGDATDVPFNLRNHPADFYASSSGDDANDGLSTNTPMKSIQALLDRYDLEGGDTVHIASGDYTDEDNILLIWSRSGTADKPVVISGGLASDGTAGVKLGIGNPSVDIRASHVDWSGASFVAPSSATNTGTGFYLTNNVGVTLRQIDARNIATGVDANNTQDTSILNSSFRNVDCAASFVGSRGNLLRNLTVVRIPEGGSAIRFRMSSGNTIENNIFVPNAGAYVYDIGSGISMLTEGVLDYNLYDFTANNSGFYSGAPKVLRKWQLSTDRDYRSAMEDALLYNIDQGDLHPKSPEGRRQGSKWVTTDTETSFAVDHGDPALPVGAEKSQNGGRINIGRFGGTAYASKGTATTNLEIRTLNDGGRISYEDNVWPLVWHAHKADSNMTVYVQYSPDNWETWQTLSTNNVYDEYYRWTISDQTDNGRWRVIAADGSLVAASAQPFIYKLKDLGFKTPPYMVHGLMRIEWEGALAGKHYIIEYSDDYGATWQGWPKAYNGPESIHRSNFVMQPGETAAFYIFEDLTSFGKSQRWYRIGTMDEE